MKDDVDMQNPYGIPENGPMLHFVDLKKMKMKTLKYYEIPVKCYNFLQKNCNI